MTSQLFRRVPRIGTKSVSVPQMGFRNHGRERRKTNLLIPAASKPQVRSKERTGWAMSPSVGSAIPCTKYRAEQQRELPRLPTSER